MLGCDSSSKLTADDISGMESGDDGRRTVQVGQSECYNCITGKNPGDFREINWGTITCESMMGGLCRRCGRESFQKLLLTRTAARVWQMATTIHG